MTPCSPSPDCVGSITSSRSWQKSNGGRYLALGYPYFLGISALFSGDGNRFPGHWLNAVPLAGKVVMVICGAAILAILAPM
jgi:hypothetical protein